MSKEVRPFKEYKEMIKDMTKEEMIKGLYDLATNCIEKDKEIERIQKRKEELQINGLKQETLFKLEIEILNNALLDIKETLLSETQAITPSYLRIYILDRIDEALGSDKK